MNKARKQGTRVIFHSGIVSQVSEWLPWLGMRKTAMAPKEMNSTEELYAGVTPIHVGFLQDICPYANRLCAWMHVACTGTPPNVPLTHSPTDATLVAQSSHVFIL